MVTIIIINKSGRIAAVHEKKQIFFFLKNFTHIKISF